jgi:hypothetical protein
MRSASVDLIPTQRIFTVFLMTTIHPFFSMSQSQHPAAGIPTPNVQVYEKHIYLEERHMRLLKLREDLLSKVTDPSTARSWVMILGSSMVRPPSACFGNFLRGL